MSLAPSKTTTTEAPESPGVFRPTTESVIGNLGSRLNLKINPSSIIKNLESRLGSKAEPFRPRFKAFETEPKPERQKGLVFTTFEKTPSILSKYTSDYFARQEERRRNQTFGEQATTELIEQPAKILKAGAVDFPRLILGGLSSVGKSILETAYTSKFSPFKHAADLFGVDTSKEAIRRDLSQPEIEKFLFKGETKTWQSVKEDIDEYVNQSPIATPWEKRNLGTTLAVAGFVADAYFPGGKGKLTSQAIKELIEAETDDLARITMIRYGLPEELAERAAPNVARAKTAQEVETAIKGEAARFVQNASGSPKIALLEEAVERAKSGENFGPRVFKPKPVELPLPKETIREKITREAKNITPKQLEGLARELQSKDIPRTKLEELRVELSFAEEAIENMPGKKMIRFQSRGRFEDFKNPDLAKTPAAAERIKERNAKVMKASESAFQGTEFADQFDNPDVIREAIEKYVALRDQIKEIKNIRRDVRGELSAIRKGERLMDLARGERRAAYRALGQAFNLTDYEIAKIRRGRDITAMTKEEFDEFLKLSEKEAEKIVERSQAMTQLKAQIFDKELDIEPLRQAMKFPKLQNMTTAQLREMDRVLQPYQKGDVFLSKRKLETIERTELAGIKTYREARERLAKKLGVEVKELEAIKIAEFDRFRGESALAERNPFFRMMVEETAKLRLIRDAEFLEIEKKLNKLASKVETTLGQKIIPQQKNIRRWFETDGKIAVDLTPAESDLVGFMQDEWIKARDYLIENQMMKKARKSENYFTHVRRGILEAVKEDGIAKASKELFDQYAMDEQAFNILDSQTGDIMALNKFFRFALHRTGEIPPTENIVEAFRVYMRTFKRKQALDEIVPLIDIYAHALTPKGTTQQGLLLHGNLIRFVKEWLNTQKGRTITLMAKQGGKIDWALRTGKALTTLFDLGFNIPVSVATQVGEQAVQYQLLGKSKYLLAKFRALTPKGRRITAKYRNFIGKNPWSQLIEPMRSAGDRFNEGVFALFRDANVRRNRNVLLGSLTKEEWEKETISPERLAQLRISTGRYGVLDGAGSIIGATPEAKMFTQYKTWALPIVGAQMRNLAYMSKFLLSRGAQEGVRGKRAFLETYRMLELGAFVAAVGYLIMDEDDDSFIGKMKQRAYQEAMTLFGAPQAIFTNPRLPTFLFDLSKSLGSIFKLETYKTSKFGEYEAGDLKGLEQLKKQLTPRFLKQFEGKDEKTIEDVKEEIISGIESGELSIAAAKEKFTSELKSLAAAEKKKLFSLSPAEYKADLKERIQTGEISVEEAKQEFLDYSEENAESFSSEDEGSFLDKVILHAKAIGTDPATAFVFLFQGEKIRKIENGAIIVERLPLEESQQIKKELGATSDLVLDHTIPLQLGGSNNKDNLKLVSVEEWEGYTRVENYLGDKLRAGLIEKKEAQSLIRKFKEGELKAEDIMQ